MSRAEAWLVHAANLLVGGTGLVYAWFRYFAKPLDEFSVVHPGQGVTQHLHVLAAPLLVFAVGLVWRGHVGFGIRFGNGRRRRSGIVLAALAAPMIASGYLLQVAVEPTWRQTWVVVHVTVSLLWVLGSLAHQLVPRPRTETKPLRAPLR